MSDTLIIDARHRLRWHQRLVSDASTATLWGVWLWLWSPVVRSLEWASHLGHRGYPFMLKWLSAGPVTDLDHAAVLLAGTSGTLLVWKGLAAQRPSLPPPCSEHDYAGHFGVAMEQLRAAQGASVCVVHHDESGRIVRLECRASASASAAAQAAA
ncbi:MAG: poly-beta-1,6-N-acetyl-D-glucosamine biosynthesis protein PgaD [Anaeromyxobacter sp.]